MNYQSGKNLGFRPVGAVATRGIPNDRWALSTMESKLEFLANELRSLRESSFTKRECDFPSLPAPARPSLPPVMLTADGVVFAFNPTVPPPPPKTACRPPLSADLSRTNSRPSQSFLRIPTLASSSSFRPLIRNPAPTSRPTQPTLRTQAPVSLSSQPMLRPAASSSRLSRPTGLGSSSQSTTHIPQRSADFVQQPTVTRVESVRTPALSTAIFRYLQLSHHRRNWARLPTSLNNNLDSFLSDIRPPLANENLQDVLRDRTNDYKAGITEGVSKHLDTQINKIAEELRGIEGADLEAACAAARTKLQQQLQRRFNAKSYYEDIARVRRLVNSSTANPVAENSSGNTATIISNVAFNTVSVNTANHSVSANSSAQIIGDNVAGIIDNVLLNDVPVNVTSLSVLASSSSNFVDNLIDVNFVTPFKIAVPIRNRFEILQQLDDNSVKSERKRLRSADSPAFDDVESSVSSESPPPQTTPSPRPQRKCRKAIFSLKSTLPAPPSQILRPLTSELAAIVSPKISHTQENKLTSSQSNLTLPAATPTIIRNSPNVIETDSPEMSLTQEIRVLSSKLAHSLPLPTLIEKIIPPGPTDILSASQTFAFKTCDVPPVKSSQPLPVEKKSNACRAIVSDDNRPPRPSASATIKIRVDAMNDKDRLTIGSKSVFEDKNNINIVLTDNIKILIIGDSNLRLMDANMFNPDWHIICIPGARLELICKIIHELPTSLQLTDIIITAGICNSDNPTAPIDQCLNALNRLNVRKHFLELAWDTSVLSNHQSNHLSRINDLASKNENTHYIKQAANITCRTDGVHLELESVRLTTKQIWQHMERFLCLNPQKTWKLNRSL